MKSGRWSTQCCRPYTRGRYVFSRFITLSFGSRDVVAWRTTALCELRNEGKRGYGKWVSVYFTTRAAQAHREDLGSRKELRTHDKIHQCNGDEKATCLAVRTSYPPVNCHFNAFIDMERRESHVCITEQRQELHPHLDRESRQCLERSAGGSRC